MALPPNLPPAPILDDPRRQDLPVAREIIGVLLAAGGLTGLIICAFLLDPLAGWAALSAALTMCGFGMIYERGA